MIQELRELGFQGEIKENFLTRSKTSYRIGGIAPFFICPKSLADLMAMAELHKKQNFPFLVIGKGSNLLMGDGPLATSLISLEDMPEIFQANSDSLTTSASISLQKVIRYARENGFRGFERLCGIPGTVGGAIKMNAGTHLGEIADLLNSFTVFDLEAGRETIILKKDFDFSYRHNGALKDHHIIISASFDLHPGDKELIKQQIDETLRRRKETQPLDRPSCGSVFRNPPGHKAWELIDQAGLRGKKIGDAQVSPMHPNWIVNLGEAKSQDVRELIELVKKEVWEKFQVKLQTEVQYID